jgi:hypothetical protein
MQQLKHETPTFPMHPICPSCLIPMHIRLAAVVNGRAMIRFTCDYCGADHQRDWSAR